MSDDKKKQTEKRLFRKEVVKAMKGDEAKSPPSHAYRPGQGIQDDTGDNKPRTEDMELAAQTVLNLDDDTKRTARGPTETLASEAHLYARGEIGLQSVGESQVLTNLEQGLTTEEHSSPDERDTENVSLRRPRPPTREVRPGAVAVPGIDGEQPDDDFTLSPTTVVSRPPPRDPSIVANPVNPADVQRRVERRIQRALENERQNAVVAEVVRKENADTAETGAPKGICDPDGWLVSFCVRWCGPRGIMLGVISVVLGAAAVIVAIVFVLTREDSSSRRLRH